ncbi:MAG: nucleotidyltransferase family protein [Nitrososphaerota archaeon]
MISVILAGGYAKRLWPLTTSIAKPLLPIGDRFIIDYTMDKLLKLDEVEKIIVSTNMRFKDDFEKWAGRYSPRANLELMYDKSYREEEKPGAVRALSDIVSNLEDDCLVLAGDNIFTDDLRGLIAKYRAHNATIVGLYDVKDLHLAKNYGVVSVGDDYRIISFEEKPRWPRSTLVSTGIYLFPRSVFPKFREYLGAGHNPDEIGRFIGWLIDKEPVYGYLLSGEWHDVGTYEEYRRASERFHIFVKGSS